MRFAIILLTLSSCAPRRVPVDWTVKAVCVNATAKVCTKNDFDKKCNGCVRCDATTNFEWTLMQGCE